MGSVIWRWISIRLGVVFLCLNATHTSAVPLAYQQVAVKKRIPPEILFSIALTESGHRYGSSVLPWPWTLNIDGQGHYFNTRNEAEAALKKAIQKNQSIDIGLMQINWKWHQNRFPSLGASLDPYLNVRVGADILVEQYQRSNRWGTAVGHYHAPGKDDASIKRAASYCLRVHRYWRKEINIKLSIDIKGGPRHDELDCR